MRARRGCTTSRSLGLILHQTLEIPLDKVENCESCAERVTAELGEWTGVDGVKSTRHGAALAVEFDPAVCDLASVEKAGTALVAEYATRFDHIELGIEGMDCTDCATKIERAVDRLDGVSHADVNFATARMRVECEREKIDSDRVAAQVRRLGYRTTTGDEGPSAAPTSRFALGREERLTLAAAALMLVGVALEVIAQRYAAYLYGAAVLVGLPPIARSGVAGLIATRRPDIKFLMTVATIGAGLIGAWMEAALVVVLFSFGEVLEGRAVAKARNELSSLVSLTPDTAHRFINGDQAFESVPVSELAIGDLVLVRPGERVSADGVIESGSSSIDQAAVTGESVPIDKQTGDGVFAGTLNGEGMLKVRVDREPGDATVAKIAKLVAEAQSRKSPSERWVDAFARVYTPIVIELAVVVAILPPLAFGTAFADSFYSALALLILACPCALVLSTPISIVSSLARASAAGLLVKGGGVLEQTAAIQTLAFDKTGTLTSGQPRVTRVEPLSGSEDDVLQIAASLEQGSDHPLALAIVDAAEKRDLRVPVVGDFTAVAGFGARGTAGGKLIEVGRAEMFEPRRISKRAAALLSEVASAGATAVLVIANGSEIGVLGLADVERPEAIEAIQMLKNMGVDETIMLTGDNEQTAKTIADRVGVGKFRAGLLPADKTQIVEQLGSGVAMVGDGVNDAPALASAQVGVAMGSAGSDSAIEVADVAIMGDDLRKIPQLIGTARWTRSVVRQNVVFSLGTKVVAAGFLAAGALPLWAAVASDVGASLVVVFNGLRLSVGTPVGRVSRSPLLPKKPRTSGQNESEHDHDHDHGHDHGDHDHGHADSSEHSREHALPLASVESGCECCDHEHESDVESEKK